MGNARSQYAGKIVKYRSLELSTEADREPIYNGVVMTYDKLLVVDFIASNIQVYNRHDGKLIYTLHELESRPCDICLISKTEVAVCLDNGTILIMSLKSIGKVKPVKTLRTGFRYCASLAKLNSDKLVVSGEKDDMLCWGIVTITNGSMNSTHDICKGYGSRMAIKDNMIYISCPTGNSITNGVYAYDIFNPSTQKFLYQHRKLKEPGSIMVHMNCVYVCDSNRIHQLTDSGQLVAIHTVSSRLFGLFYDDQHRLLYTTCWGSNVITVYKMEFLHQPDSVIPAEVLKMDTRSLQLYNKALNDGKEKVYNIRVMVVGQYGVGKTTLTQRLLGKNVNISERHSTDGIDVHVECSKVSLPAGEWTTQEKNAERYSRLQRLVRLLNEHSHKQESKREQERQSEIDNQVTSVGYDNGHTQHNQLVSKERDDGHLQYDQPVRAKPSTNQKVKPPSYQPVESPIVRLAPEASSGIDSKETEKDTVIEILQLINENSGKLEKSTEEYAALALWDFAGQYVFYTTHQTFLSRRAIYLLVIDLSKQVSDLVDDECFLDAEGKKLCKVHELTEIWLNSIHSCAPSPRSGIPPVILVGTHADKIPKKYRQKFIDEYFMEIRRMLKNKPIVFHLMDSIAIDNTQCDPKLEDLKRRIFELASQQSHWGEEKPARWLPLEQAIMTIKASGVKVAPLSLIEDINRSSSIKIEDRDELEVFLSFQHDIGTILYFNAEGLREKIVLDPQWLIDALKSLITAQMFIRQNAAIIKVWYDFKEKGKLTHKLIDAIWTKKEKPDFHNNKEHIILVMEKLNIIARPMSYTEDGKSVKKEDYYLAPCILQQKTPKEMICPESDPNEESTLSLCFVCKEKFLPPPVFHRLVGACLTHWPIAKQNKENLIYCGCCAFDIDEYHRLYLHFLGHVIFARVTIMAVTDISHSSKLCSEARKFIFENLLKITGNLGQSLEFEPHIQCPRCNADSLEGMIAVPRLQKDKVVCKAHVTRHTLESRQLLKFWFEEGELTANEGKGREKGFKVDETREVPEKVPSTSRNKGNTNTQDQILPQASDVRAKTKSFPNKHHQSKGVNCSDPNLLCQLLQKSQQAALSSQFTLEENCLLVGLELHCETLADGNCFFEAVSSQLRRLNCVVQKSPQQLRQEVVAFMKTNRVIQASEGTIYLDSFIYNESFDDYCSRMARDSEWADHVVVVAMARMLQIDIMIVTSSPLSGLEDMIVWVVGKTAFQEDPILLGHVWESHYMSLQPIPPVVPDQDLAGHSTQTQTDVTTPEPAAHSMQIPASGSTSSTVVGLIQAQTTGDTHSLTSTIDGVMQTATCSIIGTDLMLTSAFGYTTADMQTPASVPTTTNVLLATTNASTPSTTTGSTAGHHTQAQTDAPTAAPTSHIMQILASGSTSSTVAGLIQAPKTGDTPSLTSTTDGDMQTAASSTIRTDLMLASGFEYTTAVIQTPISVSTTNNVLLATTTASTLSTTTGSTAGHSKQAQTDVTTPTPTSHIMQIPVSGSTSSTVAGLIQAPTTVDTPSLTSTTEGVMQTAASSIIWTDLMLASGFGHTTAVMQTPTSAPTTNNVLLATTNASTPSTTTGSTAGHYTQAQTDVPTAAPTSHIMQIPASGSTSSTVVGLIQAQTTGDTHSLTSTIDGVMQTATCSIIGTDLMLTSAFGYTTADMQTPASVPTTTNVLLATTNASTPSTTTGSTAGHYTQAQTDVPTAAPTSHIMQILASGSTSSTVAGLIQAPKTGDTPSLTSTTDGDMQTAASSTIRTDLMLASGFEYTTAVIQTPISVSTTNNVLLATTTASTLSTTTGSTAGHSKQAQTDVPTAAPTSHIMQIPVSGSTSSTVAGLIQAPTTGDTPSLTSTTEGVMQTAASSIIWTDLMLASGFGHTTAVMQTPTSAPTTNNVLLATTNASTPSTTTGSTAGHYTQAQTDVPTAAPTSHIMQIPASGSTSSTIAGLIQAPKTGDTPSLTSTTDGVMQTATSSIIRTDLMLASAFEYTTAVIQTPISVSTTNNVLLATTIASTVSTTTGCTAGHSKQAQTDVPTPVPTAQIKQIPASGSTSSTVVGLFPAPTTGDTPSLTSTTDGVMQRAASSIIRTDLMLTSGFGRTTAVMQTPTSVPTTNNVLLATPNASTPSTTTGYITGHYTQAQTDFPTPDPKSHIMQIPESESTSSIVVGLIQPPTSGDTPSLTSTTDGVMQTATSSIIRTDLMLASVLGYTTAVMQTPTSVSTTSNVLLATTIASTPSTTTGSTAGHSKQAQTDVTTPATTSHIMQIPVSGSTSSTVVGLIQAPTTGDTPSLTSTTDGVVQTATSSIIRTDLMLASGFGYTTAVMQTPTSVPTTNNILLATTNASTPSTTTGSTTGHYTQAQTDVPTAAPTSHIMQIPASGSTSFTVVGLIQAPTSCDTPSLTSTTDGVMQTAASSIIWTDLMLASVLGYTTAVMQTATSVSTTHNVLLATTIASTPSTTTGSTAGHSKQAQTDVTTPAPTSHIMQIPASGSTSSTVVGLIQAPTTVDTPSLTSTTDGVMQTAASSIIRTDLMLASVLGYTTAVMQTATSVSTTHNVLLATTIASTPSTTTGSTAGHSKQAQTDVTTAAPTSHIMQIPASGSTSSTVVGLIQAPTTGDTPSLTSTTDGVMQTAASSIIWTDLMLASGFGYTTAVMQTPTSVPTTNNVLLATTIASTPFTTTGSMTMHYTQAQTDIPTPDPKSHIMQIPESESTSSIVVGLIQPPTSGDTPSLTSTTDGVVQTAAPSIIRTDLTLASVLGYTTAVMQTPTSIPATNNVLLATPNASTPSTTTGSTTGHYTQAQTDVPTAAPTSHIMQIPASGSTSSTVVGLIQAPTTCDTPSLTSTTDGVMQRAASSIIRTDLMLASVLGYTTAVMQTPTSVSTTNNVLLATTIASTPSTTTGSTAGHSKQAQTDVTTAAPTSHIIQIPASGSTSSTVVGLIQAPTTGDTPSLTSTTDGVMQTATSSIIRTDLMLASGFGYTTAVMQTATSVPTTNNVLLATTIASTPSTTSGFTAGHSKQAQTDVTTAAPTSHIMQIPASGSTSSTVVGLIPASTTGYTPSLRSTTDGVMQTPTSSFIRTDIMLASAFGYTTAVMQTPTSVPTTSNVLLATTIASTPSTTTESTPCPASTSTTAVMQAQSSVPTTTNVVLLTSSASTPSTTTGSTPCPTPASAPPIVIQAPLLGSTITGVTQASASDAKLSTTTGSTPCPTSTLTTAVVMQATSSGSTSTALMQSPSPCFTTNAMQVPSSRYTSANVMQTPTTGSTTAHILQSTASGSKPSTTAGLMTVQSFCYTAGGLLQPQASSSIQSTTANVTQAPSLDDTGRFLHISRLLVDVGSKVLRRLLLYHAVTQTCNLDQYLAHNRTAIDSLMKKNILKKYQMSILFPPGGSTNLDDYDITLLSALFTNIVRTISQQQLNMIQSLRDKRNEIFAHAKSVKVNSNDYQIFWNDIRRTLEALSKQCNDPDFENEISREIQCIQVSSAQGTTFLDALQTQRKIETLERLVQYLISSHAQESSKESDDSDS